MRHTWHETIVPLLWLGVALGILFVAVSASVVTA